MTHPPTPAPGPAWPGGDPRSTGSGGTAPLPNWPTPDPPPAPHEYGPVGSAGTPWSSAPTPPATPSASPDGTRRRRGPLRILGRALVVLLVVGVLAAATAWGFANRSSAEEWRDRSRAADRDLRRSLNRLEDTTRDLEDAEDQLTEVASDKANETDRNRILSTVVAEAPEVTEAMRECQEETTALANAVIDAFNDPNADVPGLQRRTDEVNQICADALDAARALEETIDELGI